MQGSDQCGMCKIFGKLWRRLEICSQVNMLTGSGQSSQCQIRNSSHCQGTTGNTTKMNPIYYAVMVNVNASPLLGFKGCKLTELGMVTIF